MPEDKSTEDTQPGEGEQHQDETTPAEAATGNAGDSTQDGSDLETEEVTRWRNQARKNEDKIKAIRKDAQQTEDQLTEQLNETVAQRDVQAVEAASALASQQLHTRLARAGMPAEDAESLLEHIDPMRLVSDGKPDGEAIDTVATSLTRSLNRPSVDVDQGQRSAAPAESADDWLRRKARR